MDDIDWELQLEKQRQKAPALIDLLNATQCQELDVDGVCIHQTSLILFIKDRNND